MEDRVPSIGLVECVKPLHNIFCGQRRNKEYKRKVDKEVNEWKKEKRRIDNGGVGRVETVAEVMEKCFEVVDCMGMTVGESRELIMTDK